MEIGRLKAIMLYVLNSVPGKYIGKHELFKILYFASQKRLVRYGYAMITDFYAFQFGPVPSELYNYLKSENNAVMSSVNTDEEVKYILIPIEEPDMEELSKADIECLNEAINENCMLPFHKLTDKSHDYAWEKAWNNPRGKRGGKIDIIDIARAANADEKTIEYIQEELELEAALR
jgi:uncharacterized phage-associated protein